MCDPLTIGSAALTAFGTMQQMNSQKKAQKGVQNAIAANDAANEKLRADSQAGVMDSTDKFSREKFDEQQQQETQVLDKRFTDNLSQGDLPGEYYGGKVSANTQKYTADKSREGTDYSQEIATALARMRGFDTGLNKNNQAINRSGEKVLMNSNFQQGNNAVLPLTIEAAKQKASNPLADIMVGIGGAGLSAGLSSAAGPLSSQGSLSRIVAGSSPSMQGPMQSFGNTGFNLV